MPCHVVVREHALIDDVRACAHRVHRPRRVSLPVTFGAGFAIVTTALPSARNCARASALRARRPSPPAVRRAHRAAAGPHACDRARARAESGARTRGSGSGRWGKTRVRFRSQGSKVRGFEGSKVRGFEGSRARGFEARGFTTARPRDPSTDRSASWQAYRSERHADRRGERSFAARRARQRGDPARRRCVSIRTRWARCAGVSVAVPVENGGATEPARTAGFELASFDRIRVAGRLLRHERAGAKPVALGSKAGKTQRMSTVGLDDPAVLKPGFTLPARLAQMLLVHRHCPFTAIVSGSQDSQGHTLNLRLRLRDYAEP